MKRLKYYLINESKNSFNKRIFGKSLGLAIDQMTKMNSDISFGGDTFNKIIIYSSASKFVTVPEPYRTLAFFVYRFDR